MVTISPLTQGTPRLSEMVFLLCVRVGVPAHFIRRIEANGWLVFPGTIKMLLLIAASPPQSQTTQQLLGDASATASAPTPKQSTTFDRVGVPARFIRRLLSAFPAPPSPAI